MNELNSCAGKSVNQPGLQDSLDKRMRYENHERNAKARLEEPVMRRKVEVNRLALPAR